MNAPLNSFAPHGKVESIGPLGQVAHADHVAHDDRIQEAFITVAPGVWTYVGNGLSNQTFIDAPEGLIAIDTGECVEEMAAAIRRVREVSTAPIVAVIYTHFHYVNGTAAILEDPQSRDHEGDLVIWGHAKIAENRRRAFTEISAAYARGLVHQFGVLLPAEGPDAVVNVGLGRAFRNVDHAPFTAGHLPASNTLTEATKTTIAGLAVEMTPAPSDANDSITIWFPSLGVAVNNLVWPTLFNVFAIRGEEYRDPRILLTGLDHLASLDCEHLLGAHGRPISGREEIRHAVTLYRDSIQFLWDQTVRGLNRGMTADELTHFVQLPGCFAELSLTRQYYGVAEHHVRQIHNGLVGWFDGDESHLFPLEPGERYRRLIEGFGGRAEVRSRARAALDSDDLRWALELATWLVRSADAVGDEGGDERALLAAVLRTIARRTTAANIRNWCLTRALDLDGSIDLRRFRTHRISVSEVRAGDPAEYVRALRVMLDPGRAEGLDDHVAFAIEGNQKMVGLHVRHGVAVPTDGRGATVTVGIDVETLALVLGSKTTLDAALGAGSASLTGDRDRLQRIMACFDHAGLQLAADLTDSTGSN